MGTDADRVRPDLKPRDGELRRLYELRFSPAERASLDRLWRTLCESFFQRYVPADATVVDLGAGACGFINHIRARRRIALDLNPAVRDHAAAFVEVHHAAITALPGIVGANAVDVAFASNVFEHLRDPDELLDALRSIRTVLRPGGRLIIMQPNIRFVGSRFWDFFDHRLPLTELGMSEALNLAGLTVVEMRPQFLPYTSKTRLPQWPWLVRLYLAVRPLQWLFGKQMLLIAQPGDA